jgi:hypothetical protein
LVSGVKTNPFLALYGIHAVILQRHRHDNRPVFRSPSHRLGRKPVPPRQPRPQIISTYFCLSLVSLKCIRSSSPDGRTSQFGPEKGRKWARQALFRPNRSQAPSQLRSLYQKITWPLGQPPRISGNRLKPKLPNCPPQCTRARHVLKMPHGSS